MSVCTSIESRCVITNFEIIFMFLLMSLCVHKCVCHGVSCVCVCVVKIKFMCVIIFVV